jgi:tetrahydromethanopterin S-methyltransferase subunit G
MNLDKIELELIITNPDEILATAKRLDEISKELTYIGYKLGAKVKAKEKAASSCN